MVPCALTEKTLKDPLSPAEAFAQDLEKLLGLKRSLTRRQWCALVESLLRLGLSAHVLWVCRLNMVVWRWALDVLGGMDPPSEDEVEHKLWSGHLGYGAFLESGQSSDSYFKRQVESYVTARLGINLLLHALEDASAGWTLFGPRRSRATCGKANRPTARSLFQCSNIPPFRAEKLGDVRARRNS